MEIKYTERKTKLIRENGRSANYTTPNFVLNCPMLCAYCVEEGTLISTVNGKIPVEKIQDNSFVTTYDSSSGKILESQMLYNNHRFVDKVFELQVGQKKLVLTDEHPVYTKRGWVKASNLTLDDEVLCDE